MLAEEQTWPFRAAEESHSFHCCNVYQWVVFFFLLSYVLRKGEPSTCLEFLFVLLRDVPFFLSFFPPYIVACRLLALIDN